MKQFEIIIASKAQTDIAECVSFVLNVFGSIYTPYSIIDRTINNIISINLNILFFIAYLYLAI